MIKIAVCDDEMPFIESLKDQIGLFFATIPAEYEVFVFSDGESLLGHLAKNGDFDVIFMDIRMNRMNGMDAAKSIRASGHGNVTIVFVTALKEYVFDAFDVGAANYLLKPVDPAKFHSVMEKILAGLHTAKGRYLLLRKGNEVTKVPLCDILYCEAVNHRVFIYLQKDALIYGGRIDDLEQELGDGFFRCHRSFLVNLGFITGFRGGIAHVAGGERIPVATRRQGAFIKALLHYQRNEVR